MIIEKTGSDSNREFENLPGRVDSRQLLEKASSIEENTLKWANVIADMHG